MDSANGKAWRRRISLFGAVMLGGILLFAGYAKLLEPAAFAQQIRLEGLDFLFSASTVAILALGLEVGLGLALLLGLRSLWVMIPATLLVVFFMFLTGRNYWLVSQGLRSPEAACGCFGSLLERTPGEAFWQDLLLLVPPLLMALIAGRHLWLDPPGRRFLAGLVAALAVMAWTWTSEDLRFGEEAAQIAASVENSGFRQSRQYQLSIDGDPSTSSQIYESESDPVILVLEAELGGGLLIDPRDHKVRQLQNVQSGSATIQILDVEKYPEVSEFTVGPEGISFDFKEKRLLLGFRNAEDP